jgi:type IV secretory pathway VirB2 component (pilin)
MNAKIFFAVLFCLIALAPLVMAFDLNGTITPDEKTKFDEILSPVQKIYNFVKYVATAIAVIFMLYAGISYMTSGNDVKKRDTAKSIFSYVIIGLIIIWAAPLIVGFLL